MNAFYGHCLNERWPVVITHIRSLADGDAADQLFQSDYGWTAIVRACRYSAPLELVQLMIAERKHYPEHISKVKPLW